MYWPEEKEQSLTVGPLEVTLTNVNSDDPSITVREFTLSNNKVGHFACIRSFSHYNLLIFLLFLAVVFFALLLGFWTEPLNLNWLPPLSYS